MADTLLEDLTALTAPDEADIFYVVDDPAGTPLGRKITLAEIRKLLDGEKILFGDAGADGEIYSDGTDLFFNQLSGGGIMVGLASSPPGPDGASVHIWNGSAGAVLANSNARLVVESDDVTATLIAILSPNNAGGGLVFGSPVSNNRAQFLYNHSTDTPADTFRWFIAGNERLRYSAATFAFQEATVISTTAGNLTLNPTDHVLLGSGVELQMNNTGGYVVFAITDSDSATEGAIWYSAADNKLEFFNGSTKEAITSSGFLWQAYENPTIYRQMYSPSYNDGINADAFVKDGTWRDKPSIPGIQLEQYPWDIGDKAIMVVESFFSDGGVHALPYPLEQALRETVWVADFEERLAILERIKV